MFYCWEELNKFLKKLLWEIDRKQTGFFCKLRVFRIYSKSSSFDFLCKNVKKLTVMN